VIQQGQVSFQLSRLMGTGVQMIDKHYGHLLGDADETT
jgi:hypothetical protein